MTPSCQHRPRVRPGLAVVFLWLALAARLLAQTTGTIEGRVTNPATGGVLENARISVLGSAQETLSDAGGFYRLDAVPAGAAQVRVFFSGFPPATAAVNVGAGQTAQRDFALSLATAGAGKTGAPGADDAVVKLDEFVVATSREMSGAALAINEQRFAANMKNVVATDEFGDIAEGNVAEFMKFLPGVAIDYSDAMPLSIGLRGMDPSLTEVSADGGQMANATSTGTSRKFDFTQSSINNIARIEVYKVPTPATSASSLSG